VTDPPPRYGVHRWKTRTYLLLVGGGGVLAASIVTRSAVAVFFGLALLLAPFAAAWSYPRRLGKVDLAWADEGTGPEVRVRGSLTGAFGSSAGDISVRVEPPPEASVAAELSYERGPREIRFATDWRLREPYLSQRLPAVVTWSDPLGLGERILEGDRPELSVERLPPELRTSGDLRLGRTLPLPGAVRTRFTSRTGEFDGLRLAAPGEPARFINWRATARLGRMVANEFEMEQRADLILLLDLRPTSLGPYYDHLLLRLGQAACLGLVRPFLRNKFRIGFAAFGELVQAVPLSSGRAHGHRLIQAIQAARLAEAAEDAQRCAYGMRRSFTPGTTTIVVTSWTDDPTQDLAPYLRRVGFPLVTLSPSPLPLRNGSGELGRDRETLARRLERLERRVRLAPLWTYGPVVDWETYESLEPLGRAFRTAGRRRVG
jgi:uncharacterized protein (DUF58 family)